MDDGRRAILIQQDAAAWRGIRGYVENVAATTSPKAARRIYNVGDRQAFTELDWTRKIGQAAGWNGTVILLPEDLTPAHLRIAYRSGQHWAVSTERIREELGFTEPVPVEAALARTIEWERAHPPAEIDPTQFDYAAEDAALAQL